MNEKEFRGRRVTDWAEQANADEWRKLQQQAEPAFDLQKTMDNGGRCLAGDRPARIVCTDLVGGGPLVVVVSYEGKLDVVWTYSENGRKIDDIGLHNALRNIPEEKTVEVTLWVNSDGHERVSMPGSAPGGAHSYWKPYGPPVPVTFKKG